MRVLPCGSTALLAEVEDLDAVLALHATLQADPPPGVVDLVPAARTLLVVVDPARTTIEATREALERARPRPGARTAATPLEVPVVYDGEDLDDVAAHLRCTVEEVVRRHTAAAWTVAFCGFAPGFGYLTAPGWPQVPRRTTPRTRVPAGAVGLAGEYSGVYPRASPGGWQLLGRTDLVLLDLGREPPALLTPGRPVRFVAVDAGPPG